MYLTDSDIEKARPGQLLRDDQTWMYLRVLPSGRKSFIIKKTDIHGKLRSKTLGKYPEMSIDEARAVARKLLGENEVFGCTAAAGTTADATAAGGSSTKTFAATASEWIAYKKEEGTVNTGDLQSALKVLLGPLGKLPLTASRPHRSGPYSTSAPQTIP